MLDAETRSRRVVPLLLMLAGIAIALVLAEIGFFASLMLGIGLPDMNLHGILVLMCRGFMISCVFAIVGILVYGLLIQTRSKYEDD